MEADPQLRADLAAEYAALTRIVGEYDGRLVTVKGWSVTVTVAGLGLGFQQQHAALFALSTLSGLSFWAVESLIKRHQVRYYPRMRQIEAWSARVAAGGFSAPRIDWAWTAAGSATPTARMAQPPAELTDEQIRRMCRHVALLPHVLVPGVPAALVGALLSVLVAVGALGLPW